MSRLIAGLSHSLALSLTLTGCGVSKLWTATEDARFEARYRELMPEDEICSYSFRYGWWCPAARPPVRAVSVPDQLSTYLGLSARICEGDAARDALREQVGLSVLHLGPEGAAVASIQPGEPGSSRRYAWSWASTYLGLALASSDTEVLVDDQLARDILADRRERKLHPLTFSGHEARFREDALARLWESDDTRWGRTYVVVEEDRDCTDVSVFTRRPWEEYPNLAILIPPETVEGPIFPFYRDYERRDRAVIVDPEGEPGACPLVDLP